MAIARTRAIGRRWSAGTDSRQGRILHIGRKPSPVAVGCLLQVSRRRILRNRMAIISTAICVVVGVSIGIAISCYVERIDQCDR